MLKVLLVDDDVEQRDMLRTSIDWLSYGCEVAEGLSDGEVAYTYISAEHPDIVITDIQMPYMDGITLSRFVKEEYPDIEILLYTSCEEFEYVRYAINIGVTDYILKSEDKEALRTGINKAVNNIEKRHRIRYELDMYIKKNEEEHITDRNNLFNELVLSRKPIAELINLAKKNGILLTAMYYSIMLINVVPADNAGEDSGNTIAAIDTDLQEISDNANVILFDRNIDGKALLLKADSEEDMEERKAVLLEQIKNVLYKYDYIRFHGGVGTTVNRLGDIYKAYRNAYRAFAQSYIINENGIIESNEMDYDVQASNDEFHISDVDFKSIGRYRVSKFLGSGDPEGVTEFVDGIFDELGDEALASNTFRRFLVVDIYFCVCEFLEGLKYDRNEIESPDITYEILQNSDNSRKYIINILEKAMSFMEKSTRGRYGDIVDEVMRYIEDNYSDDKLSLNELADHVNFSPNHLSMIFSQQTGTTFIKYLTDYRIGKAKELLRYTSKRSSEISLEVGYKDPHYFSHLFKKTQGMTPTQYRNSQTPIS